MAWKNVKRAALPVLLCCLALAWGGSVGVAQTPSPNAKPTDAPAAPTEDYMQAAALFRAGKRDEAVYWFYRGQLRYRVHLLAHPDQPPDGEPALFASLNESVGRPINEYAFGDVPALVATIDRVLEWSAASDDPIAPKARYPAAHADARAGLEHLRAEIITKRDAIRAERRANGFSNRH